MFYFRAGLWLSVFSYGYLVPTSGTCIIGITVCIAGLSVTCWCRMGSKTSVQKVMGSTPAVSFCCNDGGQVVHTALSASSIIWYWTKGGIQWVISIFGSVFRWDFRWVLNSDWDQRSAKSKVVFRLDSAIRWAFCWDQTMARVIVESKAN